MYARFVSLTFVCPDTQKTVTVTERENVAVTGHCETGYPGSHPAEHFVTVWTCPVCKQEHDLAPR